MQHEYNHIIYPPDKKFLTFIKFNFMRWQNSTRAISILFILFAVNGHAQNAHPSKEISVFC